MGVATFLKVWYNVIAEVLVMELLQLQYFFDTSKTENFAKTAEKYFVPPSSVSASVKRLEHELGCRLFDRYSNRIILNDNGRLLQSYLCIVFEELKQAKDRLSSTEKSGGRINALVRSLRGSITDAMIRYRELHPSITFKTDFDLDRTEAGGYDLIIDERNDSYVDMKRVELCSMRVMIRASSDNPLCGRRLTMSQLRHQPFVTMGENSNLHKILLRACKNAGFTPLVVMETNDSNCYGKCIRGGMGIGLSRVGRTLPSGTEYLQVDDFDESQTFYAYYRSDGENSHALEFIDFLQSREL